MSGWPGLSCWVRRARLHRADAMTAFDLIRRALAEELQRQGPAGLIVWYDAGGTLAKVASGGLPEGVRLLRWEGSYLALRLELEEADPRFEQRWVVYVPGD